MRLIEKAKRLQQRAQEFEAHPPVWAIIVVGLIVFTLLRIVRFI